MIIVDCAKVISKEEPKRVRYIFESNKEAEQWIRDVVSIDKNKTLTDFSIRQAPHKAA